MGSTALFPIFLKLVRRRCVVVGAGAIAGPKIASLHASGATIQVIAPQASPEVQALAAEGRIEWLRREFRPGDLAGAFLAIAATGLSEVNRAVFAEAERRGVLCNSVDDPPNCDFYFPAVVRRGDLQVAISTAGKSPALAQRLRREFDRALDPRLGASLDEIGARRQQIMGTLPASEARTQLLRDLAAEGRIGSISGPSAAPGRVYLIGAGPGDPGLLTIKARSLLQSADVILHDDLVPSAIVALARPDADVRNVGKRCGPKKITQAQINALTIEAARGGRSVARLKSGDPSIFGRLNEEIGALESAGVGFEVVPGVTAALAAAALAGCSLTDRDSGARVVVVSNHHAVSNDAAAGAGLQEAISAANSTLVFYMPGHDFGPLREKLLRAGVDPATPAVLVSCAGQPGHREKWTTLAKLPELPRLDPPSVLLIGRALRRRKRTERAKALALLLDELDAQAALQESSTLP